MSSSAPNAPKDIINYPTNQNTNKIVMAITSQDIYKEAKSFRIQVLILIEFSRYLFDGQFKLTYDNVAELFDVSVPIIHRAYMNGKKDVENLSRPNGRPFSLTKDKVIKFKEWYEAQSEPPKYDQVKAFISNMVGQELDYKTYINAIHKIDLKVEEAESIDADRYFCSPQAIDYYYTMLAAFFLSIEIPSYFVFNVDEEGHDEYVDAKKKELLVVPKDNTQTLYYPVKRRDDHTTFVACIAADGSYLKPLIVVKRKTIEARILRASLFDKVVIKYQETGYINSDVFNYWVTEVFIPEVNERRKKFNYSGPAVLIIDGCPSHYTDVLFDSCNQNNIKIFFIPPHSSNQTQMLDLATFNVHKINVRKARLFEIDDDNLLIDKIIMLYDSFQKAATYSNIRSSFEVAGAVYDVSAVNLMPIVKFSIDFTTKIWHHHRTSEEKAKIRELRKGKGETELRVKLDDFNKFSVYWQNDNIKKVVEKMPKILDYSEDTILSHRLQLAFIDLDKSDYQQLNDKIKIKKGRPSKKEDEEKKEIEELKNNRYLNDFTYEQRIRFELESLGFELESPVLTKNNNNDNNNT